MVDDGETLSHDLIQSKLAEGGGFGVVDRSFEIVNPATGVGQDNGVPRIDPSAKSPARPDRRDLARRPDLARNLSLRGRRQLVICQQIEARGAPTPDTFEARAGSGPHAVTAQVSFLDSTTPPLRTGFPRQRKRTPQESAPATAATTRRPTRKRAQLVFAISFKGNWNIVSILDDGQSLGPELIRQRFAQSGRVRSSAPGRSRRPIPRTEERRISAYRLDPSKTPSQIDVTTQFDSVLKGIYTFEGDAAQASAWLAKHEDGARPTAFEGPARLRSFGMLIRLSKLAASDRKPAPSESGPPTLVRGGRRSPRRLNIRHEIVGSWAMREADSRGTLTIIFFKEALRHSAEAVSYSPVRQDDIRRRRHDSASGTMGLRQQHPRGVMSRRSHRRSRSGWSPACPGHLGLDLETTRWSSLTPSVPSRPTTARSEPGFPTEARVAGNAGARSPRDNGSSPARVANGARAEIATASPTAVGDQGRVVGPTQVNRRKRSKQRRFWYGEQRAEPTHYAGLFTGSRTLPKETKSCRLRLAGACRSWRCQYHRP